MPSARTFTFSAIATVFCTLGWPGTVWSEQAPTDTAPIDPDLDAVWQQAAPVPPNRLRVSRLQGIIWNALVQGRSQRELWVSFTDTAVSYYNGCNWVSGEVSFPARSRMKLGRLTSTLRACHNPGPGLSLQGTSGTTSTVTG